MDQREVVDTALAATAYAVMVIDRILAMAEEVEQLREKLQREVRRLERQLDRMERRGSKVAH